MNESTEIHANQSIKLIDKGGHKNCRLKGKNSIIIFAIYLLWRFTKKTK